jgi:hypothetical protein
MTGGSELEFNLCEAGIIILYLSCFVHLFDGKYMNKKKQPSPYIEKVYEISQSGPSI